MSASASWSCRVGCGCCGGGGSADSFSPAAVAPSALAATPVPAAGAATRGWRPPDAVRSLQAAYADGCREPRAALLAGLRQGLFELKRAPDQGDWLAGKGAADRKGQTFEEWNARCHRRPQLGDAVQLVPIAMEGQPGAPTADVPDAAWFADCVRSFFFGVRVEVLPAVAADVILGEVTHRESQEYGAQLYTQDVHRWLSRLRERSGDKNVFATVAYTLLDLYPGNYSEYVYGQGNPALGTGVLSLARYLYVGQLFLRQRCFRVMCHEMGHLFGLRHCIWYECIMGGSSGAWESDRQPLHACPVCLAKLDAAFGGVDLLAREACLEAFWWQSGHDDEALWNLQRRRAMEREVEGAARGALRVPSSGASSASSLPAASSGPGDLLTGPSAVLGARLREEERLLTEPAAGRDAERGASLSPASARPRLPAARRSVSAAASAATTPTGAVARGGGGSGSGGTSMERPASVLAKRRGGGPPEGGPVSPASSFGRSSSVLALVRRDIQGTAPSRITAPRAASSRGGRLALAA